ncbi:MAG TPA: hypothetical protein VN603_07775 [Candidatus Acidoferrales bacterium]|nr:hypothetical protein [Candidatus Acidoferrales bacterium]
MVVAGCPGQRSEFACDRIFGDVMLARGYAYVCDGIPIVLLRFL